MKDLNHLLILFWKRNMLHIPYSRLYLHFFRMFLRKNQILQAYAQILKIDQYLKHLMQVHIEFVIEIDYFLYRKLNRFCN